MPEQKQVSFLSWKDLGFLLSLTFLSVPNEDLAWIHASFLFALVTLVLAVGQGLGTLGASQVMWEPVSIQAGHELHIHGRPEHLPLEPALPAVPLRAPRRPLGLGIFLLSAAEEVGELCSESLARAHQ